MSNFKETSDLILNVQIMDVECAHKIKTKNHRNANNSDNNNIYTKMNII